MGMTGRIDCPAMTLERGGVMLDETIYQAVITEAAGSFSVAGAGGVTTTGAAGGEAGAATAGQPEAGAGTAGRPEPGGTRAGTVGQPEAGKAGEGRFELGMARRALASVRAMIEAFSPAEVLTVRVDVQKVAALVITLIERDSAPERRPVFERFAAQGNYDITLFERLLTLAQAVWYLRRQQQRLSFLTNGAPLSEEDRLKAFELRAHLMRELEYNCRDMPDVMHELAYLRQGSGHQDLANDLETLVDLAQRDDVRPRLQKSPWYREGDLAEATRLAGLLLRALGVSNEGEVERVTGLLQRGATLLLQEYEKHCLRGRFLFHEVEDIEVTYPSLYAAARAARRKRKADEPAGGEDVPGGAGSGGGEGPGDEPSGETPVDGV
jgi:hypothetical protein